MLAQKDDEWKEWGLEEVAENLKKYVDRNPLQSKVKESCNVNNMIKGSSRTKSEDRLLMHNNNHRQQQRFQYQQTKVGNKYVYCGLPNH